MDLRQIRQFIAVAEELHFGRAAQRLNMTQPPLSMSIRALEGSLGVQLFQRTQRKVALTEAGRVWLDHARRLMADAERLPLVAQRAARGELGQLRIAFVTIAGYRLVPHLVQRFRAALPDVRVELREATSDMQLDALAKGDIDVGLIIRPGDTFRTPLAQRPLPAERLVAAIPKGWRGAGSRSDAPVAFDEIADAPLIFFPRHAAPAYYDTVADHYRQHGRSLRVFQEAIQMQTIIGLVAAGLGFSLVPESMTGMTLEGAGYHALAGTPPAIGLSIIWNDTADNPALASFLALLED